MEPIEHIRRNLESQALPLTEGGLPGEPCRLLMTPGVMNLDYYPPLLFLTLYRPFCGCELDEWLEDLCRAYPGCGLLVQDRSSRPFRIALEKGEVPEEFFINEGGLEYYVQPRRGQNPGFFIDMRDGRKLIGKIVGEKKEKGPVSVLNLFAYTCSLSVAALASGAEKVVNIDMNRNSLNLGKRNHRLNHKNISGGYVNQALFLAHDVFKSFGKLRREGPYSLIIADPPPSQKGSFDLRKDYPKLLRKLPEMLTPEGELLLTLNSPEMNWEDFEALAAECLPGDYGMERIQPPPDFRAAEEGRGLKLLRMGKSVVADNGQAL